MFNIYIATNTAIILQRIYFMIALLVMNLKYMFFEHCNIVLC